jgi:hypothetical protein
LLFSSFLNLIGNTWIEYNNFKPLETTISNIKTSFVQNNSRKRRCVSFLNSLSNNSQFTLTLPPLPIKTRWNSWFNFVFWVNEHMDQLHIFFLQEEKINNESKAIKELAITFNNSTNTFMFEILTMFIAFNAKR